MFQGLIMIGLGIPATLYRGWVLSMLWLWFLVPSLGVPSINFVVGAGIVVATQMLVITVRPKAKAYTIEEMIETLVFDVVMSSVSLLFGFILFMFM